MKNLRLFKIEMLGALFISVIGSLLHFTYRAAGSYWLVGVFSAVNESTWEHLKLAVIPAAVWLLLERYVFKVRSDNFFFAKTVAVFLPPILIVGGFYGYTALLGDNFLPVDISLFVFSVISGQYVGYRLMTTPEFSKKSDKLWLGLVLAALVAFAIFTFYPPRFFLFKEPINQSYGINKSL